MIEAECYRGKSLVIFDPDKGVLVVGLFKTIIRSALLCTLLPAIANAGVQHYTGTMQAIAFSGKGCQGQPVTMQVELLLRKDQGSDVISGYFEGQGISTGKFSGNNVLRLDVRYPYHDESKAAGHSISIAGDGDTLTAELRDRHLEPTDEDCSFDQARMTLVRSGHYDSAARFSAVAGLFDAQLTHSQAFHLASTGRYAAALPLYEKALSLVDLATTGDAIQAAPYITTLANAYIKLGRIDDFNKLFDQRIAQISDKAMRAIYSAHCVHFLLQAGRASLYKEEYPESLEFFQKAYRLAPQNPEAGSAVVMIYLRTGRHDSAISFLEEVLKTAESESSRKNVRIALANMYLQRAQKFDGEGKIAEASADLAKADSINPDSALYLIALARLRHKYGNLAVAEELLQQGFVRFQDEPSRQQLVAARDRMQQTEAILKKLR